MSPSHEAYQVLFLCTGNSARSILAEAILNRLGAGRFCAHSAGSHPRGQVHPMALAVLSEQGHATSGLRSKSWDEFAGAHARRLDFVFTLCDAAAGEACPVWPGRPMTSHWGIEDPAAFEVASDRQRQSFRRAYRELQWRMERFVALPIEVLDRPNLQKQLDEIGRGDAPVAEAGTWKR